MIELVPSTLDDVARIREWARRDAWHHWQQYIPDWWLTGNGYLSLKVQDEVGPIAYVRIDREERWFRLHCQFGPRSEVSRRRMTAAIDEFLRQVFLVLPAPDIEGVRFDSENPSLIKFLTQRGFERSEQDDYVYRFEGVN